VFARQGCEAGAQGGLALGGEASEGLEPGLVVTHLHGCAAGVEQGLMEREPSAGGSARLQAHRVVPVGLQAVAQLEAAVEEDGRVDAVGVRHIATGDAERGLYFLVTYKGADGGRQLACGGPAGPAREQAHGRGGIPAVGEIDRPERGDRRHGAGGRGIARGAGLGGEGVDQQAAQGAERGGGLPGAAGLKTAHAVTGFCQQLTQVAHLGLEVVGGCLGAGERLLGLLGRLAGLVALLSQPVGLEQVRPLLPAERPWVVFAARKSHPGLRNRLWTKTQASNASARFALLGSKRRQR